MALNVPACVLYILLVLDIGLFASKFSTVKEDVGNVTVLKTVKVLQRDSVPLRLNKRRLIQCTPEIMEVHASKGKRLKPGTGLRKNLIPPKVHRVLVTHQITLQETLGQGSE